MTTLKKALCLASISIGALWFSIAFTNFCSRDYPGARGDDFFDRQQYVFFFAGYDLFGDYIVTRDCAALADPYRLDAERSEAEKDAGCPAGYPALALAVVRLFPLDAIQGGLAFTVTSIVLWILSLLPFFGKASLKSKLAIVATIVTSQIFLYSFDRGNLIFLSAAAANLFLAWYDSPSPSKRTIAAIALAFATVLKVAPAVLGLLYFREKQWKEICCSALATVALFVIPFLFWGGMEAIPMWIENASHNTNHYSFFGAWGGAPIFNTLQIFNLIPDHNYKLSLSICRAPFQILALCGGIAALLWTFRHSRMSDISRFDAQLLLVLCTLLLPGNMMEYTGLYLMPFFITWCLSPKKPSDNLVAVGLLLLFFQLQIFTVIRASHFNLLVHNIGFLLIVGCFYARVLKRIRQTA